MNVKPVLGSWEIPSIASIQALEQRRYVELPVPGRVGSLFQDMNTSPTRIAISGSLYSDEKRSQFLEELRGKFQAGEPVTFVADITTATEIQYVIIETMEFAESGLLPDQTVYTIILKESPPPPPPPNPLGGLDDSLLDQAGGFLDTVTGALDVIDGLGNVPDFGNPVPPLESSLDQYKETVSGLEGTMSGLRDLFGITEHE